MGELEVPAPGTKGARAVDPELEHAGELMTHPVPEPASQPVSPCPFQGSPASQPASQPVKPSAAQPKNKGKTSTHTQTARPPPTHTTYPHTHTPTHPHPELSLPPSLRRCSPRRPHRPEYPCACVTRQPAGREDPALLRLHRTPVRPPPPLPVMSSGSSAIDLRVGNKYRIGRKIGSGSFGDIYLGPS